MTYNKKINQKLGAVALPLVIALTMIILAVGVGMTTISFNQISISNDFEAANRATAYAETGVRDALEGIARDKTFVSTTGYTVNIASPTGSCSVVLDGCASVKVHGTISPKIITSTGTSGSNVIKFQVDAVYDSNGAISNTTWVQVKTQPTVSTAQATSVTQTSAILNGATNPNGNPVSVWFRYSPASPGSCSDTFGARLPASGGITPAPGSGSDPVSFVYGIGSGLSVGTPYYYCAIGDDGTGNLIYGQVFKVTTAGTAGVPDCFSPTVQTLPAVDNGDDSITINGEASPNNCDTTGWFRYSTTNPVTCNDTFGIRVPFTPGTGDNLGSGGSPVAYSRDLTGLTAGTYYFCAIASNLSTSLGSVLSFTYDTNLTALAVSTGAMHSCALISNGTIKCWGLNNYSQLGNGTTTNSSTPVTVSGISNATQISAGGEHTCAFLADSTIKCWGRNTYGQLGNGTTTNSPTPVAVTGISTATQISAGGAHTCARLTDSTLKCWGNNSNGRLGDGTSTHRSTPVSVTGITTATQVSSANFYSSGSGGGHTCALLSGGTLKCWGYNDYGQLGDNSNTSRTTPVSVIGISNATQISTGGVNTCAIVSGNSIKCWGGSYYGQLGNGTDIDSSIPVSVVGISNATHISVGGLFVCARLSDSTIKCWGYNSHGNLGNGTVGNNSDNWLPVLVSGISNANDISSHGYHSCTFLSDSNIKCWGYNGYGQLGNGTTSSNASPVYVVGISSPPPIVAQTSVGYYHSCARLTDSSIKCFGRGDSGQLGNGAVIDSHEPVLVSGISTATQVSSGLYNTCVLISGSIKCWGLNDYSQLGNGLTANSSTPVSVSGISTATQVSPGYWHTCALLSGGTVKCWGRNNYGQLGDSTTTNRTAPVLVTGISNATQISAGAYGACALLFDSTIKCWGYNAYGQLGDGTLINKSTPVTVSGISNATQVFVNQHHACARLSDSTIKCWGYNGYGQLGNGGTTNSSVPVTVSGISNGSEVSLLYVSSCVRLSDNTIKCWGYGSNGELGNGTTTSSSTPVSVIGISNASQISSGGYHSCARLSDSTLKCWGYNSNGQLGNGTTSSSSAPVVVIF